MIGLIYVIGVLLSAMGIGLMNELDRQSGSKPSNGALLLAFIWPGFLIGAALALPIYGMAKLGELLARRLFNG